MLLIHRKLLQSKAIAIENDLRATLRNFGLKVGVVGTAKFEARIQELVENVPDLIVLVEPLLIVRRALREFFWFCGLELPAKVLLYRQTWQDTVMARLGVPISMEISC